VLKVAGRKREMGSHIAFGSGELSLFRVLWAGRSGGKGGREPKTHSLSRRERKRMLLLSLFSLPVGFGYAIPESEEKG
jgi:hypothetical protein